MTDISAAADALIAARREKRVIDALPGGLPGSIEEAYAIQDAAIERMGEAIAGWKVAFTNAAAQEAMKTDAPAAGPMFASYVHESPAAVSLPDPSLRLSECEFAFRLSADLPAKAGDYTDDDIAAVVASVHPAIEIADRRMSADVPMNAITMIADFGGNAAFAFGTGTTDWQAIDFPNQAVRQLVDGAEQAVGSGAAVSDGNPLGSVTWLANNLKGRGHGLKKGDWVSSGLATQGIRIDDGGTIAGDFGSLGTVELRFA